MNQVSADDAFGSVEFAENPEPRVPCVLILDISQSMQGNRINELNAGLRSYKDELLTDPLASKRVEVAIVTFGGDVNRAVDFVTANKFEPPTLLASGNTPMGQAINNALDMIEERKSSYREHGIAYYRPWAFLITDGAAERPLDADRAARQRRRTAEVVFVLCRRRRRRRHASAQGNLRPRTAAAPRFKVSRALRLAFEFAAGGVSILAWRRSSAPGSDGWPEGLGSGLGCCRVETDCPEPARAQSRREIQSVSG